MKLQNLSLHFHVPHQKKKIIFNRLNLNLPDQGMVVITGDSGVGKSSLLKVIAKIIKPSTGKVILPQSSTLHSPVYLSDQLELIPHWKVSDYLNTTIQRSNVQSLGFGEEELNKTYQQLSIGQKVRLKIILFLSQPACVYLLDEPTHALDEFNRKKLIDFLILQSFEKAIIIATHDQDLIETADVELKLESAFQTSVLYHQHRSRIANHHDMIEKHHYISPWPSWFRRLERLHRGGMIGGVLSFAIWIVQLALVLSTTFTFQIQHQMDAYSRLIKTDPWLEVVEVQTIPIHDSPFQLVKTFYPSQDSFRVLFQDNNTTLWLVDISTWFPKTIEINHVEVTIRFVDLPFDDQHITTSWIYPNQALPDTLVLSGLSIPNQSNFFSFSGPIRSLHHRTPLTWFEPPQLLLSYWQWLSILTHHETTIEEETSSYLDAYLNFLPPSQVLMYDYNLNPQSLIESLSNHPWRFTVPTEKVYPLINGLMEPLLNFLPIFLFSLIMIWIALWWSTLHWIYQQHRRHWQWMIVLHQPFKKIWFHLTLLAYLRSMVIHAMSLIIITILMPLQSIMPLPPLMMILVIEISLWTILESLKLSLRNWFNHA